MPNRKRNIRPLAISRLNEKKGFRQRYRELDERRAALVQRLERVRIAAQQHPSMHRATKLLNDTFRASALAQRAAILQAADWLITLLESTLPMM